jgi:hypothetical protein
MNADEEAKAKRLLIPRARGLCERFSHLPPNATETILDVDLNTRERQTANQLCQWLLIAEPHLKQQEKAVRNKTSRGRSTQRQLTKICESTSLSPPSHLQDNLPL